jgi:hypothetical protein
LEFIYYLVLLILYQFISAEPENSDSRNAGQTRPIEDPALAGKHQVFQGKIKPKLTIFKFATDTRKMSFRYSRLCGTASDAVDAVKLEIP